MAAENAPPEGPVFFWQPGEHPYGFLSQWYPCAFTARSSSSSSSMVFLTTEQYMMYHKAILFDDAESAEQIMKTTSPKEQQSIGRKVRGFERKLWDQNKEKIVEEGNWNKFTNAKDKTNLKDELLNTAERELVEASPFDRIWGVGFDAENAEAHRKEWGENLLGKAMMRVRERLKK